MPPKPTGTNPYQGKFVFKPLALPKAERKSLFTEYYYPALVSIFLTVAIFAKAAGMSLYDATVTGLWIAAMVFFVSQILRYWKHRVNPEAEKNAPLVARQAKPQKPGPPAILTGKALGKAALNVKPLPKPSPLPAAPPTLNSKPYDKPFITPYAKKRLPEIPQTDKKQS